MGGWQSQSHLQDSRHVVVVVVGSGGSIYPTPQHKSALLSYPSILLVGPATVEYWHPSRVLPFIRYSYPRYWHSG
jgi:hypothetical protein